MDKTAEEIAIQLNREEIIQEFKQYWSRLLRTVENVPSNLLFPPIIGINDVPTEPIEDAVARVNHIVDGINEYTEDSLAKFSPPLGGLESQDEIVAINLYTREWPDKPLSLYYILNDNLCKEDRDRVKPFYPFLKLFLTGLSQLPKHVGTVWHGVNMTDHSNYKKGNDVSWWAFTSCTIDRNQIDLFLKQQSSPRVLFKINCSIGVDISCFSNYPDEAEVLLPPISLHVMDVTKKKNLVIIKLQGVKPLIEL